MLTKYLKYMIQNNLYCVVNTINKFYVNCNSINFKDKKTNNILEYQIFRHIISGKINFSQLIIYIQKCIRYNFYKDVTYVIYSDTIPYNILTKSKYIYYKRNILLINGFLILDVFSGICHDYTLYTYYVTRNIKYSLNDYGK